MRKSVSGIEVDQCGNLLCGHCGSFNLHPVKTYVATGQDGSAPYHVLSAELDGRSLKINPSDMKELDQFAQPNRMRELDTFLLFTCEECQGETGVTFGFHKGSVMVMTSNMKAKV